MVKLKPKPGLQPGQRVVIGTNVFEPNMTIDERFIPLIREYFDYETIEDKKHRKIQEVTSNGHENN